MPMPARNLSRWIGRGRRETAPSQSDSVGLRSGSLLFPMLLDPWSWIERSIERLTLKDAHHVEVSSRYQIHLKAGELPTEQGLEPQGPVRSLLPLSTRPKRPLLSFRLHGHAGRPVQLLTRREIAGLQRGLVAYMLALSPLAVDLARYWPDDLLEAIFSFTPDVFRYREASVRWRDRVSRGSVMRPTETT